MYCIISTSLLIRVTVDLYKSRFGQDYVPSPGHSGRWFQTLGTESGRRESGPSLIWE